VVIASGRKRSEAVLCRATPGADKVGSGRGEGGDRGGASIKRMNGLFTIGGGLSVLAGSACYAAIDAARWRNWMRLGLSIGLGLSLALGSEPDQGIAVSSFF